MFYSFTYLMEVLVCFSILVVVLVLQEEPVVCCCLVGEAGRQILKENRQYKHEISQWTFRRIATLKIRAIFTIHLLVGGPGLLFNPGAPAPGAGGLFPPGAGGLFPPGGGGGPACRKKKEMNTN
jgi:hypothetical protein